MATNPMGWPMTSEQRSAAWGAFKLLEKMLIDEIGDDVLVLMAERRSIEVVDGRLVEMSLPDPWSVKIPPELRSHA